MAIPPTSVHPIKCRRTKPIAGIGAFETWKLHSV
jgi:hypothetical protein